MQLDNSSAKSGHAYQEMLKEVTGNPPVGVTRSPQIVGPALPGSVHRLTFYDLT